MGVEERAVRHVRAELNCGGELCQHLEELEQVIGLGAGIEFRMVCPQDRCEREGERLDPGQEGFLVSERRVSFLLSEGRVSFLVNEGHVSRLERR